VAADQRRRRPVERRNRDGQILEAAITVFSEKGYAGSSLQDVADMVGLLKGSLYHYISSKESLLFRIFQEAHEQARAVQEEIDARRLAPDERLRTYVESLTLWYLANLARSRLYFTEWRYLTGEERETVRGQRREFERYLRGIITEATEAGLARPGLDVRLTSFYILSAVNTVPIWYRPAGPSSPEQIAEQVAELAHATVFAPGRRGHRAARGRASGLTVARPVEEGRGT